MLRIVEKLSQSLNVEELLKNSSFRRTIYIGIGGFGSSVVRMLKKELSILPDDVGSGFSFLALDTHTQPKTDILTLNEYISLSVGVDPQDVVRNTYPELFEWYRKLLGKWQARKITDGAGKVKALGRFSFMFPPTHSTFWNRLNSAFNNVNTDHPYFSTTQPPQAYIISSLAGGTGAGCLIDVIATVEKLLSSKTDAEFRMQLIIATPEALEGVAPNVDYPEFYANTYATLKEMLHFILGNPEKVKYGISELGDAIISQGEMPKPIWIITGLNESGISRVEGFNSLANLVSSYMLSEIMSPLEDKSGQPNALVNENPIYDRFDDKGMPKWFSSFGIINTGMPRAESMGLYALKIIDRSLSDEIAPAEIDEIVDGWVSEHRLSEAGVDDLQEAIKNTDPNNPIVCVRLETEVELEGTKRADLGKICRKLKKDKFREAVKNKYTPAITKCCSRMSDNTLSGLVDKLSQLIDNQSIGTATCFLRRLEEKLKIHKGALADEAMQSKKILLKWDDEVNRQIANVEVASHSWFVFSRGKTRIAIDALDTAMENYFRQQVDIWVKEAGLSIYDRLLNKISELLCKWVQILDLLASHSSKVRQNTDKLKLELDIMSDESKRGRENWYSLVDSSRALELYKELFGESEAGISLRMRKIWREKGLITNATMTDDEWLEKAIDEVIPEIEEKLATLDFSAIMEKFYPSDEDKKMLFDRLSFLSSPLFPVNKSREQGGYTLYLLVAANPSIRDRIMPHIKKFIHSDGLATAYHQEKLEITLFTVKHGYTLHSLRRIDSYQPYYNKLQMDHISKQMKGHASRPIHGWLNADEWDEPIPSIEDEEVYRCFILGRALSYLYPTAAKEDGTPDERKNRACIYNRGNNYFIYHNERETKIGNGLPQAVENFESRSDWVGIIEERIDEIIAHEGNAEIGKRLESEYLPIVMDEKEKAQHTKWSSHDEGYGRAKLLENFVKIIQKFLKEIRGSAV